MRFIVDAQLPPVLARWLKNQGHEAEHVADRQMATASDEATWNFAILESAVILTKDEFGSGFRTRRGGIFSPGSRGFSRTLFSLFNAAKA